jgi:hypothetical protein
VHGSALLLVPQTSGALAVMPADAPQHLRDACAKLGPTSRPGQQLISIALCAPASFETTRSVARCVVNGNKLIAEQFNPLRPAARGAPEHPADTLRAAMKTVLDSVITSLREEEAVLPSPLGNPSVPVDRQYIAVRRALLEDLCHSLSSCGDEWFVFKTATGMLESILACVYRPQQEVVASQGWAALAQANIMESLNPVRSADGSFVKPLAPRDKLLMAVPVRTAEMDAALPVGIVGVASPTPAPPVSSVSPAPASPFASSAGMQLPWMMFPPFMPPGDWGNGPSGGRGRGRNGGGRGSRASGRGAASSVTGVTQHTDTGKAKRQERDASRAAAHAEAKSKANVQ